MNLGLRLGELFSCAGKVAIVTGAGTGIGCASAEALAAAGARVTLAGLAGSGVDRAAVELRSGGYAARAVTCDVTDDVRLDALVADVLTAEGRLDIVVANAGAALDTPDANDALDRLDRMYALNVRAVARLAERTAPAIAEAGGGSFIVMSSIAGLRGNQVLSGYGVTKAANAQLVRNLAVRWGNRNVRANAVSPGVIDTAFARSITGDDEAARARLARTPLGRFGTAAEVAGTVLWLASPAGAFVSGQNIVVDGGTLISD
jgi:NAD(P)-dependent dehydrogenase (short-subunit alcohol dehydrogenase family)